MSILLLDVTNAGTRIGAIAKAAKGGDRWVAVEGDRAGLLAFAKARRAFRLSKKNVAAVVVAMNAPGAGRSVTWSGVRAGIATANALAFAWGVPVAAIAVRGDESEAALAGAARDAASKAVPGEWVRASYSGEPNITKPKAA